jgi:hypothetical protein
MSRRRPGRWTAWAFLQQVGDGFPLLVVWMARSGQREIVVLAAVRQSQLLDHVLEASFMDSGWSDIPGVLRGFFRVKCQRSSANGGNAYGY